MPLGLGIGLAISHGRTEGVGGIASLGADLALWFDTNQAYKSSGGGIVTPASILTVSRASAGWYFDSTGTLQQASSNTLRRNYDPATGAALGLLVEEQRTNLLLNSAALSTQSVTVTAAAHTLSYYGTGTITLTGVSTAGPLVGTGANNRVALTFTPTAGTLTLTVTGDVRMANLERGNFATSPIITAGSQATRAADQISIETSNFPYADNLPGTLVAEFSTAYYPAGVGVTAGIVGIGDGSPRIFLEVGGGSSRPVDGQVYDGTTALGPRPLSTDDLAVEAFYKASIAWTPATSEAIVALSGTVGAAKTGAPLNMTLDAPIMKIGSRPDTSAFYLNGHIKRLSYYASRKPNAQLQALTT